MDTREHQGREATQILFLPGWHNSGPRHWQTYWENQYGGQRVEQHDWEWPRRGDWMARLEEVIVAQARPVFLVAHSLGCQLVASWANHTQQGLQVQGAMLVAPADPERADAAPQLFNWRPVALKRLPFPSTVVASSNDPYCATDRSRTFGEHWGSEWIDIGAHGHINAESRLEDWPAGQTILDRILQAQA